jgi:hypothetical protein
VYYIGTSDEWSKIDIATEGNSKLTNATLYYYSAVQPTTAGNYWHYDECGFKISSDDEYLIDSKYFKVTPDGNVTALNADINGGCIGGFEISEKGFLCNDYSNSVSDYGFTITGKNEAGPMIYLTESLKGESVRRAVAIKPSGITITNKTGTGSQGFIVLTDGNSIYTLYLDSSGYVKYNKS